MCVRTHTYSIAKVDPSTGTIDSVISGERAPSTHARRPSCRLRRQSSVPKFSSPRALLLVRRYDYWRGLERRVWLTRPLTHTHVHGTLYLRSCAHASKTSARREFDGLEWFMNAVGCGVIERRREMGKGGLIRAPAREKLMGYFARAHARLWSWHARRFSLYIVVNWRERLTADIRFW